MSPRLFTVLLLSAVLAAFMPAARADSPATRAVFALVVTSNHGVSGDRPDLRYADDDGVKYLELFRMLAPEANVRLHTELDPDTERLYPWARELARPPTSAAVAASIAELTQRVTDVTRLGGTADFYFVFAGHGDVAGGTGFLELRDARFTSGDVELMLRSVAATRSHVILDSCNSFFVMNARKPGGRPVATTAVEARSLSERLPGVGVFLSTSSEAEVFEWSELQAGIFSHVVRSGLTGAADANGDGEVSYEELRAFVSVASAHIKNPLYRPTVFARGPGGEAAAPLVRLSGAHATALRVDGPQIRMTLRDADDVPLVDLHKEAGAAITVLVPDRWATHAFAEERDPAALGQVLRRLPLDGAQPQQPIVLAELTPQAPPSSARGAGDVFRMLFADPFGPRAMTQALVEVRQEDAAAVYGVSEDDVQRMRILLEQAAGDALGRRATIGAGYVTFGAVLGGAGGFLLSRNDGSSPVGPGLLLGYCGVLAAEGIWSLAAPSGAEGLYRGYVQAMQTANPSKRAQVLATAESALFGLRQQARRWRSWERVLSFVLAGSAAAAFALHEVGIAQRPPSCGPNETCNNYPTPAMTTDADWATRLLLGSLFAAYATVAVSSFVPYPVERLADVWESDPGRVRAPDPRPSVAFAPAAGGGQLQLGWKF